jgi:hypothetical protein
MSDRLPIIEQLMATLHIMLGWIKSYRTPLTVVIGALFMAGLFWSFRALSIDLRQLHFLPALIIFIIMGPLGIAYGAIGLALLARVAGTRIAFGSAWSMAGYAQLAESLPIPGGAIVRTVALKNSGTSTAKSVTLVTGAAILWVAMSMVGAGLALLSSETFIAIIFLTAGGIIILPIMAWMIAEAGMVIAMQIMLHRLFGLVLMCLRMLLAFAIINMIVPFKTALFFSFANIAGSASAITPAGLGVGEAIAAAMAGLVQIAPAAAFLAIALNRIISLASCATVVMVTSIFKSGPNRFQFTEKPK